MNNIMIKSLLLLKSKSIKVMIRHKNYLITLILHLISLNIIAQNQYIGKPGSCYGKCKKPDIYDTSYYFQYIFTGDRALEKVDLDEETIVISPAKSEWVKTKTTGCRSSNPDDCLVWCKVDKPAEIKYITSVQNK
jgi:hypothetical protein